MAAANPQSLPTMQMNYWIRLTVGSECYLKKAVRCILHNTFQDPAYTGLPDDPSNLFKELKKHQSALSQLKVKNKKVLTAPQWNLLYPTNKLTYSKEFDIPLMVVLLEHCTNLKPPVNGWRDSNPSLSDQGLAANSIRARSMRHFLYHYGNPTDMTKTEFSTKWDDLDDILRKLGYKVNTLDIKTGPLDPHRISYFKSVTTYLEEGQKRLLDLHEGTAADVEILKNLVFQIRSRLENIADLEEEIMKVFSKFNCLRLKVESNSKMIEQHDVKFEQHDVKFEQHDVKIEQHDVEIEDLKRFNRMKFDEASRYRTDKTWNIRFDCNQPHFKKLKKTKNLTSQSSQIIQETFAVQAKELLNKELGVMHSINMSTIRFFSGEIEPVCAFSIHITSRDMPLPDCYEETSSPESNLLKKSLTDMFQELLCKTLRISAAEVTINCNGWYFQSIDIFFSVHFSQNILKHAHVPNIISSALLGTSAQEVLTLNGLEGYDINIKFENDFDTPKESLLVGFTIHLYGDIKGDVDSILLKCESKYKDVISQELVTLPAAQDEEVGETQPSSSTTEDADASSAESPSAAASSASSGPSDKTEEKKIDETQPSTSIGADAPSVLSVTAAPSSPAASSVSSGPSDETAERNGKLNIAYMADLWYMDEIHDSEKGKEIAYGLVNEATVNRVFSNSKSPILEVICVRAFETECTKDELRKAVNDAIASSNATYRIEESYMNNGPFSSVEQGKSIDLHPRRSRSKIFRMIGQNCGNQARYIIHFLVPYTDITSVVQSTSNNNEQLIVNGLDTWIVKQPRDGGTAWSKVRAVLTFLERNDIVEKIEEGSDTYSPVHELID